MTYQPEPTTRGHLAFKRQLKLFSEKRNFVNARSVFLECRKQKIEIPEAVLEVITAKFKSDQEKYLTNQIKRNQATESQPDIEIAIECLANSKNQEEALEKYKEITNENTIELFGFRLRVERYLLDLFPQYSDLPLSGLLQVYSEAAADAASIEE